jgi:predicted dienelactone hydrolase
MAAMRKAAANVSNFINRPQDVTFVLDQITKLNKEGDHKGKFDLDKVGVAGHSFGAHTTLACSGQVYAVGKKETTFGDARIKAAIAMSPSAPARTADMKVAFGKIKVPVYHLTGTKDDGVGITETKPEDRRKPYDNIAGAPQYLTVFEGGDHMVFSGRPRASKDEQKSDEAFQALVLSSTTAFWKAHLLADEKAKAWLADGFSKELGDKGKFEAKK